MSILQQRLAKDEGITLVHLSNTPRSSCPYQGTRKTCAMSGLSGRLDVPFTMKGLEPSQCMPGIQRSFYKQAPIQRPAHKKLLTDAGGMDSLRTPGRAHAHVTCPLQLLAQSLRLIQRRWSRRHRAWQHRDRGLRRGRPPPPPRPSCSPGR